MPRRTIRLTAEIDERLQSTAKLKGYANPSAFLRAAIDHELSGREETMIGAEERLAASMETWAMRACGLPGEGGSVANHLGTP
jgi:Arc/MetJ-type ribon-helix-helix transcriptional regulator